MNAHGQGVQLRRAPCFTEACRALWPGGGHRTSVLLTLSLCRAVIATGFTLRQVACVEAPHLCVLVQSLRAGAHGGGRGGLPNLGRGNVGVGSFVLDRFPVKGVDVFYDICEREWRGFACISICSRAVGCIDRQYRL